jgi:hypothetical protein
MNGRSKLLVVDHRETRVGVKFRKEQKRGKSSSRGPVKKIRCDPRGVLDEVLTAKCVKNIGGVGLPDRLTP